MRKFQGFTSAVPGLCLTISAFFLFSQNAVAVSDTCSEAVYSFCNAHGANTYDNSGSYSLPTAYILAITCYYNPGNVYIYGTSCNYPYSSTTVPKKPAPAAVPPVDRPANRCGSIIHVDNQSVGERVPLVGVPFDLVYFSDRVAGRAGDSKATIYLTGSDSDDPYSATADIYLVTSTSLYLLDTHTSYHPGNNVSWDFVWNGLDSSGNPVPGSGELVARISEQYSDPTIMDFPVEYSFALGNFKAASLGIGGWLPSIYHFYDQARKMLYMGDGSTRTVTAQLINSNTNYRAASADGSEVYIFDLQGRILYTKNGLTGANIYSFAYDTSKRLTTITDAFGNQTSFVRNTSGVLTGVQGPYGQTTSLTLTSGYLTSVVSPASETYTMTYTGSNALLHTFQKPRGQTSTFTYDAEGVLQSDSNSAGNSFDLTITAQDNSARSMSLEEASALGRTTDYALSFNPSTGAFTRVTTDPQGTDATLSYVPSNSSSYSTGDMTRTESFTSDVRLGSIADFRSAFSLSSYVDNISQSATQSVTYVNPSSPDPFAFTELQTHVSNSGHTTDIVYTSDTYKTEVTTPVGRTFKYFTNPTGQPTNASVASYLPVEYNYDSHGRLQYVVQGCRRATIEYNSNGYVSSFTDFMDQATTFTYNSAGRLTSQTLPDTRHIDYTYDANGNLATVTPPGKSAHTFTWSLFDLAASYVPPALSGTPTVTTSYTYNDDKQLTSISRPDSVSISLTYDTTGGQLNSMTLPSGDYTFTYDHSRLKSALSPDGIYNLLTPGGDGSRYTSDAVSDYPVTSSHGTIYLSYGAGSRLESSQVLDSTSTLSSVSFSYDYDYLLTQAGSESLSRSSTSGLLTGTTLDQIADTLTYDDEYAELATYQAVYAPTGANTNLLSQSYGRDKAGRIVTLADTRGSTTHDYAYSFDSSGRLTDVTKDSVAYSHYNYDSNSNRTSGNVGGVSFAGTYDSQDRLTSYNAFNYTYNLNGELATKTDSVTSDVTTYTFDGLGNLKSVALPSTTTITYLIDGLNRRQSRKVGSTLVEQYVYEDSIRIGAVLDGSGVLTHRFVYGSKANVPDYMIKSGTRYRLISDPNGSVRLVVNSSTGSVAQEITYDEFGKVLSDTNPGFQPFGFAGGLYDQDTKLTHFGAREYDAETGRWLSKDPILFKGGDTNLYGYVLQDPVNFTDPSGLAPGDIFSSPAQAARDAVDYIQNGMPGGRSVEYGTFITPAGKGYTYANPVTSGSPFSVNPGAIPNGVVASLHTHPFIPGFTYSVGGFSNTDYDTNRRLLLPGFIGFANGSIGYHDPFTGKDTSPESCK